MDGYRNYNKYLSGKVLSNRSGYILGTLYHLKNKDYPAYIDRGNSIVYGQILEIENDDVLINQLDTLENCLNEDSLLNEYEKKDIDVFIDHNQKMGQLPVYVYNEDAIHNKDDVKILISYGSWDKYKNGEVKYLK